MNRILSPVKPEEAMLHPLGEQNQDKATPISAESGDNGSRIITDFYLQPGHLFVSDIQANVLTILGSCVSVALWDPETNIGGINHFMLPFGSKIVKPTPRFGNHATAMLIEKIENMGGRADRLRAKIFGGAHILGIKNKSKIDLGRQNIEAAFSILEENGIRVIAQDVGGNKSRKLIFSVTDGAAWVKIF